MKRRAFVNACRGALLGAAIAFPRASIVLEDGRESDWDAVVAAAGLMDSLAVKGNAFACENERDEMIDTYYVRVIAAHLNEP